VPKLFKVIFTSHKKSFFSRPKEKSNVEYKECEKIFKNIFGRPLHVEHERVKIQNGTSKWLKKNILEITLKNVNFIRN